MTKLIQSVMKLFRKIFLITVNLIGALIALLGIGVLLIGVLHGVIALVANAGSPIFLYVLPTVTLGLSAGVVFLKQPVHSLLCLISVFFSAAILYLFVGAEFLAFLFLIVYVGAIAILFLFVIMLLQLKSMVSVAMLGAGGISWIVYLSGLLAGVGLNDMLANKLSSYFATSSSLAFKTANSSDNLTWFVNNRFSDILIFSDLLYTYHCYLFFVASLLLLTAMLGAIILATSATDDSDYRAALPQQKN